MVCFTRNLSFLRILSNQCSSFMPSTYLPSHIFFSTAADRKPSSRLSFIAAYLISSIGLSPEKAIKASKEIRHIKTPAKPDAVLQFLLQIGLDDEGIRSVVSRKPTLLCTQVERTLKPKVRILQQAGFSDPEIAWLITQNPFFLHRKNLQTMLKFLGGLYSSKEDLFKAMIKNTYLLCSNLEQRIIPNVSYLRTCGLSNDQIASLMRHNHRLITMRLDSIKSCVQQTIELGFSAESRMFQFALQSTFHLSRTTIDAKFKTMRSFGFSEAEISSAIMKAPHMLFLSVKNIKSKLDFFVKKAGCELSYVITRPQILCFSFEKRLIPRNHVLQVLKSEGLPKRKCGLFYCMTISDRKFTDKFIQPYQAEIPDLNQVYLSACSGKDPVEEQFS